MPQTLRRALGLAVVLLLAVPAEASITWSTYLGGTDAESASGLVALQGDLVLVGYTTSDDFPVTGNAAYATRHPGGAIGRDAYVARVSSDGASLLYATYLGGSGEDLGAAIALLPGNRVVVLGQTDSTDFPVTADAAFATSGGGIDLFLAWIDLDTGALVHATYFGGSGNDFPRDLVAEPDGSVVVLGDTSSSSGGSDLFLARFSSDGSLAGARYFGGSADESGGGIERASDGSFWIAASSSSSDFPGATGSHPGFDAIAAHVSSDLSTVLSAAYVGGAGDDRGRDLALATDGASVVLFGTTESDDFPVSPSAIQTTRRQRDLFVARLDATTLGVVASTYFGTAGTDTAYRVRTDASGAVVLVSSGFSGGAPTTPGAADRTGHPQCNPYCFADALVARLTPTLTNVAYATYLASSNGDGAQGIEGTVAARVAGSSGGYDFPTTSGTLGEEANLGASSSSSDAFAALLDLSASAPKVVLGANDLSWPAISGADGYEVVRGDLATLRANGELVVDACIASATTETSVSVPETPSPETGWWILARAVAAGTPTSFDDVTTTQRGSRDGARCP